MASQHYDVHHGGLAHPNWKNLYTPAEIEEIVSFSDTTMFASGPYPIHVRIFRQPHAAPTVVMSHPMLLYGLLLAQIQLPFFRAGFNVIQWDLPGWGQSGGPRAGCPMDDFIVAWRDAIDFAVGLVGGPIYTMGIAEDSVTSYYSLANHPQVQAMSLHTIHQFGDPRALRWHGPPWLIRLKAMGLFVATKLRPTYSIEAHDALPWDAIFSGPGADRFLKIFDEDPIRVQHFEFRLGASMLRRMPPEVKFEDCRTPVQVILSENSRLWPAEMNLEYFERLGGPKELINLAGTEHWVFTREFHELYCAHIIRWFKQNGAVVAARFEDGSTALPARDIRQGTLEPEYLDRNVPER
jgi:alpha-beta hydrolase superfamily lysophospholipase